MTGARQAQVARLPGGDVRLGFSNKITARAVGHYRRVTARLFARRLVRMRNSQPLISFTFDDFPRAALFTAGTLLENHGVRGTYYVSLGLAGQVAATGEMFHEADISVLCKARPRIRLPYLLALQCR